MPNSALNNITAPDQYAIAATLDTGNWLDHINIDVVNQAIYWQIKQTSRATDTPQLSTWQAEVFLAPSSRTIDRPGMTAVRIRAATPAASLPVGSSQAQVTVEIIT